LLLVCAAQSDMGTICKTPGSTDITENRATGLLMAKQYLAAAGQFAKQVAIFRAYLTKGCAGSFNQLFSGDGFTYTGVWRVCSVLLGAGKGPLQTLRCMGTSLHAQILLLERLRPCIRGSP
jgi:hypothetical protein